MPCWCLWIDTAVGWIGAVCNSRHSSVISVVYISDDM